MEKDPRISPHQGRELELMLKGEKPLAKFAADGGITPEELGDADFAPYVSSGQIRKFTFSQYNGLVEWRLYCLPGEEWRAKLSIMLIEKSSDEYIRKNFTENDLHRMDGNLLGYSQNDIEFFIETLEKNRGKRP